MIKEPPIIQIKGTREGLMVNIGGSDWDSQVQNLIDQINERPAFYQGARMVLNVQTHVLHVMELSKLRDTLSDYGLVLWAVLSESQITEQTSQNLGLATRLSKPETTEPDIIIDPFQKDKALWIKQTVRSGSHIEYHGNIIILGDVNPGAEIIAVGSVLVWGRLRGLVHAGAEGDEEAIVGALDFSPMQLRIAGKIAVSPKKNTKGKLEIARISGDHIIAESWNSAK
ncbi:MAG TPA: septum site-determining protein MinC [Anaerolineales bacterium]|nr:septum site-determining protein MinC [Anaerolineales bacterium]